VTNSVDRWSKLASDFTQWCYSSSITPYIFNGDTSSFEIESILDSRKFKFLNCFEALTSIPEEADLLIVTGKTTVKLSPYLKKVYSRMSHPKLVMAVGSRTFYHGPFESTCSFIPLNEIIPVDAFVSGIKPLPEDIIDGLRKIVSLVRTRKNIKTNRNIEEEYSRGGDIGG
jgi:NADH-quinone oxidoreductase subunit B